MAEGGTPPAGGGGGGRPVVCKKPRQFQPHWWDFMAPLPSQVRRPLRDALSLHRRRTARLRSIDAAREALRSFKADATVTGDSVDARMQAIGMEYADPSDRAEAAAFLDRLGQSGRKALAKRDRVAAAIFYAESTIAWLEWELTHDES